LSLPVLIPLAFLLDLLFGDPAWFPHPVRVIGWLAGQTEKLCRFLRLNLYFAGLITVFIVLGATGGVFLMLLNIFTAWHTWLGVIFSLYILYASIAARDLAWHSMRVSKALCANNLPEARQRLAMIVGRDTRDLDAQAICRGAVESVAENIVDGITAPLFWAAIFGPLGAIIYKAVNTMDSMFGYKNERYAKFGMIAARLDDLANLIPARLTAVLIIIAAFILKYDAKAAWHIWRRDHNCHKSPNSAHSEAAVAGALGLQFGGPNKYFGQIVDKPYIGDDREKCQPSHIRSVVRIMYATTIFFVALAAILICY
jgi:adenosylcobinamide-phosphate synthase